MQQVESINTELDEFDKQLIRALQSNARLTNVELADMANLSPSACHRRVKSLIEAGYFDRFAGLVNPYLFGYTGTAIVSISLDAQREALFSEFEQAVCLIPQVKACYLITGEYDYQLTVIFRDTKHFEELYYGTLLKLPGVNITKTQMVLRKVHNTQEVPIS